METAASDTVISTRGLTKHFGSTTAVDDVDLDVRRGEVFGFLGPNGSGKTTTIRMLTGRLQPSAGTAQTLGLDMPRERDQLYPRIGAVGDRQSLYERLSTRRNLALFADLHGQPRARADELLERFGLAESAARPAKALSLGMRQKLLLARAFIGAPDLIFLDEPTRGLDPNSARLLRSVIREENARGCTVFLTTHDMEEADQLCDRVGLIVAGRLAALDTPTALKRGLSQPTVTLDWQPAAGGPLEARALDLRDADTPDALATLLKTGTPYGLRQHEPSLEDAFVALTGASLRDEGSP